jgi:hypothetical protein
VSDDEQFSCGLVPPKSEVVLSDEQVELLHRDPEVVEARQRFFAAKLAGQPDDQIEVTHQAYLRVFYARLAWVLQNPLTPKSKPLQVTGFAKRA